MALIIEHVCKKNQNGNGAKCQDKWYGKGNRVANKGKNGYTCTVCGELITFPKILWEGR